MLKPSTFSIHYLMLHDAATVKLYCSKKKHNKGKARYGFIWLNDVANISRFL